MVRGRAELVLGVIVTAVGAYALSVALRLTLFGKNHVPGPGLFPTLITIGMLILGVLLATLSVRDAVRSRAASAAESVDATGDDSAAEGASQRQRLLRAGIVFLCYAIVMPLMPILGFVPAAALLVLLVLIGVERRLTWKTPVAAILIPVAAFYLFVRLLSVPLPVGVINLGPLGS